MFDQVLASQLALGKKALEMIMELAGNKGMKGKEQLFKIGDDEYIMTIVKKGGVDD